MSARVCHIITMLELGGAQQNTLYTVEHLDRARFTPSLLCGPGGLLDPEARRLVDVDVRFIPPLVREIRPGADLHCLVGLTSLLRRTAPQIVHTHSSKAGIVGRWAAHLAGVPVIVHSIHGFGFHPGQSPAIRSALVAAERAASLVTTKFVAVSEANRDLGERLGLFEAGRAVVIRSGIDLDAFRDERAPPGRLRAELGAEPSAQIVGMIGCLKPQKAPEDFVAVAARLAARFPGARFVLAGDGELRPRVEAAVAREGLVGRFHLLGWRRDVPAILRDLDVLALTSRWEGLPRVFPEAMASGKPIVACRVDGAPEAVVDGVNGWLCEPGDVEALAARIGLLLEDPARARRMGLAGRRRVAEWDINEMVRAQERLYEGLLEQAGLPAGPRRPRSDRAGPS